MNPPELALFEGTIRATVLGLSGLLVYLIMRRWSPAAGSLTAATPLVVMGVVSLLALCPWPRWRPSWPIAVRPMPVVAAPAKRGIDGPRGEPPAAVRGADGPGPVEGPRIDEGLLAPLVRAWDESVLKADEAPCWTWREWTSLLILAAVAIGSMRLLMGLLAMRRIRPVGDGPMDAQVRSVATNGRAG